MRRLDGYTGFLLLAAALLVAYGIYRLTAAATHAGQVFGILVISLGVSLLPIPILSLLGGLALLATGGYILATFGVNQINGLLGVVFGLLTIAQFFRDRADPRRAAPPTDPYGPRP